MSDAKHLQDLVRQARRKYNDNRSEKGDLSIPPFFASELWAIYRAIDAAFAEPDGDVEIGARHCSRCQRNTEELDGDAYTLCSDCWDKAWGRSVLNTPLFQGDAEPAEEQIEPDADTAPADLNRQRCVNLEWRVNDLEKEVNMLNSGHPKDEVLGFSAGHNTREDE